MKDKLADDWLQNIKLMNDKNKSTSLIKQNNQYLDNYQKFLMLSILMMMTFMKSMVLKNIL
ncbi:hypothetical protein J4714_04920 [Staphylococcus epidermidis]|nr:hypothetical protein [Staphylococcus epidermidis]